MTMDAYRGRTLPITLRRAEKLRQGIFDDLSRAALARTATPARSSAPTRRLEQRERGAAGGVLAVTGALRPQRLEGGALGRARAGGPGHRQGDSSEPIGRRGRPDRRDRPRPRHAGGRVIRGGDRSRIERLISELLEEL